MPDLSASSVQRRVATAAARQHGIVTAAQLRATGLSKSGVWDWTRAGRLHRLFRGVYAVGHRALSFEARWMAAVLALGKGAVLSHRSAAMLWRVLEPAEGLVHVTVISSNGKERRRGLVFHRSSTLNAGATTIRNGIPVTVPARTLTDLRRTESTAVYRRALRQAEFLRYPIAEIAEADGSRSGLESSFSAFCRRRKLPVPEANAPVGRFTADFLWRDRKVIVETDSFRTHGGPVAFEEDRERDLWLKTRGYTVVRVTDRQLETDPGGLAASLRTILCA